MTSLFRAAKRWLGPGVNTGNDNAGAVAENQKLREDLALSYRALAYYNLHEGVVNHLSVRAPARSGNGEVMLVNAFGTHWSQITANSLIGVDFESGEVVEGEGDLDIFAQIIHLAIHKVKAPEGTKCVMHTHQPYTTAIACCHGRLKNYHQSSMFFHNRVWYDDNYGDLTTAEEGERTAECIVGKDICIMGNHGVTVCGKRICDAFHDIYLLERACMYQVLAMSTGMEPVEIPEDVVNSIGHDRYDIYRNAHFEAMRLIIAKMEPDYRS